MVFSGKHNRNARRGQSLFTAARRPWPFFVVRRRAKGAFFVRTPARGSRRGAQERGVMLHHGRWASRVDGGGGRSAAGLVWDAKGMAFPRSYHPLGASDRILAGLRVQGPSLAWSVADAHGGRRPCHPPRAARDTTVRMSCHGENEVCDGNHCEGNHDDSRVITRA
jgi:hypothetical protein